jgi:hypothetical protein
MIERAVNEERQKRIDNQKKFDDLYKLFRESAKENAARQQEIETLVRKLEAEESKTKAY